ncbi:hypothetical protein EG328_001408 [Venturia inaequalis]|uniref:Calcineurin-like phosphoesterase domain-containing protein n=1 Tax=Venturia inaequalis TaxID=5025 RepID=A0A8H3UWJ4_VENIN|nr:hypothetical protein EG328_001408 [Venturia inaequalis]KAE9993293.1 hypothetical protein EG327_005704 [Venturia inaequalis]
MLFALPTLLAVVVLVHPADAIQPEARSAVAAPLRDLPWGQLNILHTTDVHGWFGGHLQEPSFSADWGDYISFAHHLRQRADQEGVDLILVDTGDRVEGNGLYDGSDPKGRYTFDILKQQKIDLICSGNHELYKQNSSENEFYETVPSFKGNYLASNLDIYNPETGKREALAPRYKKFTTKNQGIRVLAFGFLFDFTGNANNTVVQPVGETIKEGWFQKAIRDKEVDLILVFGHVGLRMKEYETLYKAIRGQQWDTPIVLLGGHTHIRDFKEYDRKAVGLESGRYMETIGFMSVTGLSSEKKDKVLPSAASLKFARRYMDNNLFSMHYHSGLNETTFPTEEGNNASTAIHAARSKLRLNKLRGCSPVDLFVNRAPYPHKQSIFTWLEQSVLPSELGKSSRVTKEGKKALVLTNTGAMRFDIFRGPFTRDTEYLVSPFTSGFNFVPDVPLNIASKVLAMLNSEGPILSTASMLHGLESWMLAPPEQIGLQQTQSLSSVEETAFSTPSFGGQAPLRASGGKDDLLPGYTTTDDYGKDGDDTEHSPITFYRVPNCIQAPIGFELKNVDDEKEVVDLVYNEFIQPWVLLALEYLGHKVSEKDTAPFVQKTMTDVLITASDCARIISKHPWKDTLTTGWQPPAATGTWTQFLSGHILVKRPASTHKALPFVHSQRQEENHQKEEDQDVQNEEGLEIKLRSQQALHHRQRVTPSSKANGFRDGHASVFVKRVFSI